MALRWLAVARERRVCRSAWWSAPNSLLLDLTRSATARHARRRRGAAALAARLAFVIAFNCNIPVIARVRELGWRGRVMEKGGGSRSEQTEEKGHGHRATTDHGHRRAQAHSGRG